MEEKIAEWHAQIGSEMETEKEAGRTSVRKSIPHAGKIGDQPQVYEAVCSVCGKKTYVPFQPDGKRAIYCKSHRNAGQQVYPPDRQAQHQQKSDQPQHKTSEQVFSGANVRTMNSSFQKSPELSEETVHLSELGHHKKAEPKLDELRKILGEVLGDEETDVNEKEGKKILKPGEKIKLG